MPNKVDIAIELSCARVTVRRVLRTLAGVGQLDRAQKLTRVALHPIRKATLSIPLIGNEIAANGKLYGYHLPSQRSKAALSSVAQKFALLENAQLLDVFALHEADGNPMSWRTDGSIIKSCCIRRM